MTSESPDTPEITIPKIRLLLQLLPIILVVIYVWQYVYAFQFLTQFGVTPEEVGISELKLLTRAAELTLVVIWLYASILISVMLLSTAPLFIREAKETAQMLLGAWRMLRGLQQMQEGKATPVDEKQIIRNQARDFRKRIRRAIAKPIALRVGTTLSFTLTAVIIILLMRPLGEPVNILAGLLGTAILSMVLFIGLQRRATRYTAWAVGATMLVALLGSVAYAGAAHEGVATAATGRVPGAISVVGIDILQVHPQWISKAVVPSQYHGQDLLELGANPGSVFLYDCSTRMTYSIPLSDIALTYNGESASDHRLLDCG